MAVDYLQEYLGIDPNDYSAMEQRIAGVSPVGQSILPQAPVLPRASIMDESDFAAATAPLMGRVYGREEEARNKAEDLANQLQGLQANLQEITNLRDVAVQDYQEALQQQDVIRQQASENEAMRLEEQRNQLLAEREGIITTLEQDFGVQRSELESVIGGLEGQVGDLTSKVGELESVKGSLESQINDLSSQMQALEVEKQDALAQQDVIRAEAAQSQQDALAQQGEQFATERSALEQQIADLTAQVGQQPPGGGQETGGGQGPIGDEGPPLNYMEFIESGRTPAEYNQYMKDYIARTMPDAFPDLSGLQNVTDETRQLVQDSLASGDPILAPDRIQEMIDNMSAATGEGGLPEGYSYTPGPGSEGKAYTTVMPRQGFRYAYGPEGDRIQVPDNKPRIDRPLPPPPLPPREKLIPPKMLPPKRDDQLFIDDRPRDPRLDITRGKPIGGPIGGIEYGPVAPPPGVPDRMPIPLIPNKGGGTYKEFQGQDGQVISVGVKPPSFNTNPNPKKAQLVDNISSGLGTLGIASQPLIPSQQTTTRKQYIKPPSIGGVGGISGRRSMRPMMRAGGGAIGQAIADLQNRLR